MENAEQEFVAVVREYERVIYKAVSYTHLATYARCCQSRNRQATEVRGHFPPGIRRQTVLH